MHRVHRILLVAALLAPFAAAQGESSRQAAPRWWKGNLHTHSLWSDGNDFPENIAAWYKEQGWHFLTLSDHNVLSVGERWMKVDDVVRRGGRAALARYRERFGEEWVETRDGADGKLEVRLRPLDEFRGLVEEPGSFLMVQSEEISDGFKGRPIHMNASNLVAVIKPQHGTSVRRTMDRNLAAVRDQAEAQERPILLHLNHPNFGWGVNAEDLAAVLEERFFEVYNGHPSIHHLGDPHRASVEKLWDIACTLRIDQYGAAPPYGLGTDDSHHYFTEGMSRSNSGRGWVQVRAASLDADALMTAMLAGDFYASSGVTLADVRFEGGRLSLEIEAEKSGEYTTQFVGTRRGYDRTVQPARGADGALLPDATWRYSDDVGEVLATVSGTSPSYVVPDDVLYVRAVVTSSDAVANPSFEGQRQQAWTQPVGWRRQVAGRPVAFDSVRCDGVWSDRLRGLAVDPRGSIYWSFGSDLVRSDERGHVLAAARGLGGVGDLCFRNGRVLAIASGMGEVLLELDGATLEIVARHELKLADGGGPGVLAGIGWVGSVLFVGRQPLRDGLPAIHLLDPSLTPVRSWARGDLPVRGAAFAFAEGRLWVGRGEAAADAGGVEVLDMDGAAVHRGALGAGAGLAALPAGRFLVGRSEARGAGWVGAAQLAIPAPDGGLAFVAR